MIADWLWSGVPKKRAEASGDKSRGGLGKGRAAGAPGRSAEVKAGPAVSRRCAFVNGRNKIDGVFSTYASGVGRSSTGRQGRPVVEPLDTRRLFASAYSNGMNLNDEAVSAQHFAYSLAEMKNLGITSVRVWMTLDSYADRPNVWDTDPPAGQVDMNGARLSGGYAGAMARAFQLKKLGFHVLLVINPDPLPTSDADVTGFFQHLMNATETPTSTLRLRDVVDQWEIGNEPDSQNYWEDPSTNKTARLQSYVDKFLLPAASVLHSGPAGTWEQVISAGVSYSPDDLNTILSYLSSKNQLGAIDYAGFHPYGTFDPDTGANQQATNILRAKQFADTYGKKMIATEWSVRGYSVTGTQDDKYARALDLNYRNYILPNFESAYYFALVNNWPGRGGSTSARPAGVLEHADSTGITPTLHPDLLGDYYASALVRSQPFYSTVQGWDAVTPDVTPAAGSAVVGAVWYDFNGDAAVSDQERLAGNQRVWVDLNGDRIRDAAEPTAVSDANGAFSIEYPTTLIGLSGVIRVESTYPQTVAPVVTLGATTQLLGVAVGIRNDVEPAPRVKGSITGTVWADANNNGVRESTEAVAAGRIVYADENNDGTRQLEEYAVRTDGNGRYMLRFLDAGTYAVRLQGPAGEVAQSRTIVLQKDQRLLGQDIAVVATDPPSVTLEAESATLTGGTAVASSNGGYTGTGYADFAGIDSAAEWKVSRATGGGVTLGFRYANGGTTNRPMTIYINGVSVGSVPCVPTGAWTTWATASITVTLSSGSNVVKAVAATSAGGANVDSLTVTRSTPAWLSLAGGAAYSLVGSTLTLTGGTATLLSDAGAVISGLNVSVSGGGKVVFNTTEHLGQLTLADTSSATLVAGGAKVLKVTGLNLSPTATLDLNDHAMIYDFTPAGVLPTSVAALIRTARGDGAWTGPGVTSTAAKARAGRDTTLGTLSSADYLSIYGPSAKFEGESIDATAVLVRYTLGGDADLDGGVSINDFNRLSTAFGALNRTWIDGDFDYDGGVSINDFNLLSSNFGKTLT